MTARLVNTGHSVTWRYAALGAAFGLCFPAAVVLILYGTGTLGAPPSAADLVAAAHAHSPLLYVVDTAPVFLGLFAGFAGTRQERLAALNASLEERVAAQTASLRDALQRAERTNAMISHMADHDALTGLFNRRRMQRELLAALSHAARYGESLALVFIDLDRFKAVNDHHGHDAGDRFLSAFAALLERAQRDTDRLGRWGGDEFVVLLPHATRTGAQQFAERLQEELGRTPIDIGPAQVAASASLGLAVYPDDGVTPEALLAHADEDMYRAKRERDQAARLDEHA